MKQQRLLLILQPSGLASNAQRYQEWVHNAVGIIEGKGNGRVVVRVASHWHKLPNAMSWLQVGFTNADGTDAEKGA